MFRRRHNEIQEIFFIQHPCPPPVKRVLLSSRSFFSLLSRPRYRPFFLLQRNPRYSRESTRLTLMLLPTEILIKKLALITTDTRAGARATWRIARDDCRYARRGVQAKNSTNAF